MNIAFWDNQLCERGTSTSLFDYAYYNEKLLGNKSFIFFDKNNTQNKENIIMKFRKKFIVHPTDNFKEVDYYLKLYKISHIYIIKSGQLDNRISKVAKNCIHCVFNCSYPHGDIYASISPYVYGNNKKYPSVPHMINLPKNSTNMRNKLKIPENAIVFGGYGGKKNFNISFVKKTVYNVAKNNPNIFFLFANYHRFCDKLPNIIHLPMIIDLNEKVSFINTCDAKLWARKEGETFGIAIGEFCYLNKPIIAMKTGDKAHIHILRKKAIWYSNEKNLKNILLNFNPSIESKKDWNAYKNFTPKNVMSVFKKVFLD